MAKAKLNNSWIKLTRFLFPDPGSSHDLDNREPGSVYISNVNYRLEPSPILIHAGMCWVTVNTNPDNRNIALNKRVNKILTGFDNEEERNAALSQISIYVGPQQSIQDWKEHIIRNKEDYVELKDFGIF